MDKRQRRVFAVTTAAILVIFALFVVLLQINPGMRSGLDLLSTVLIVIGAVVLITAFLLMLRGRRN
jgi:uncharacterized membrane-anchored protein